MAKLESQFQREFIDELRSILPGCIVLKNDPNYIQGFPDLLCLHRDKWFAFEVKAAAASPKRPNQVYYVDLLNEMSYATFVHPGNMKRVLDEVQRAF